MKAAALTLALAAALLAGSASSVPRVEAVAADGAAALPMRVGGRAVPTGDGGVQRQWPGTYFETAFTGSAAAFDVGAGKVSLNVLVDGRALPPLVAPAPGRYRVSRLTPGRHRLRVEVASESQEGPTVFAGFRAAGGTRAAPLPRRAAQIEFIGDSHTVGYGNRSATTQCSRETVWRTTDTSASFGPLLAKALGADYRIHAISGRGVVRNYDGFAADTLPQAYPYALFDHRVPADTRGWAPQSIVIGLGTNDFSTPLHAGEAWPDRGALHRDYEDRYAAFVRDLRHAHPHARILLWATDLAKGEIAAEADKVVRRLRAEGDGQVGFVAVPGLAFSGCDGHPSAADDRKIMQVLGAALRRRVLPL